MKSFKLNFEIEVFEEIREVKRILVNESGETIVVREEHPEYTPLFFQPNIMDSFMDSADEGDYLSEESMAEPMPGTVESIFELNTIAKTVIIVANIGHHSIEPNMPKSM